MRRHVVVMLVGALVFGLALVGRAASAGEHGSAPASGRPKCQEEAAGSERKAPSRQEPRRGRNLAGGYPGRRVALLVARAAVIARGTVESVETLGDGVLTTLPSPDGYVAPVRFDTGSQGGLQPDQYEVTHYRARFHVSSVVKGTTVGTDSTLAVDFYLPYLGPPWTGMAVGEHGLLLLGDDGKLAELSYPLLPIASSAPSVSLDLSPRDAVGQFFLLSLRQDTPPAILESCLDGVLDLGVGTQAIASLRALATSKDPAVSGIGLRGLVELKDPPSVPAAVAYLLSDATVPAMPQVPVRVGVAIGKLDDPNLALDVVPLLSSSSTVQRDWALQALRKMRNPAAIPALVTALSDPDQSIQYGAMMGIAETVGAPSEWLPSDPLFKEDPQRYLDHWLSWWETDGEALYGPVQSHSPGG